MIQPFEFRQNLPQSLSTHLDRVSYRVRGLLYFRNVDVLSLVIGKYVRANSIPFFCFRFQIDQQVTVRFSRRVSEGFHHEITLPGIHLSGQIRHLTGVAGILEQDHVVGIQIHGAHVPISVEQILGDEHDRHVSVVGQFGE